MKRKSTLYPLEMMDEYRLDASNMTAEHVIRWLFEFGAGYVPCALLDETWVDKELLWRVEVDKGYLKPHRIYMRDDYDMDEPNMQPYMSKVKLTQKALDLLKENENGV